MALIKKRPENKQKKRKLALPEIIIIIGILLVFCSFLAFYLIDLHNIFAWREALFATKRDYFFFTYRPFFFQHWGRNSGPAELIQWLFLASSAIGAAFIAGYKKSISKRQGYFWLLMAIAFTLMLLEDAGNIRHTLMSYVQAIFKEAEQGWAGTSLELIYFSVLGGLPLYTLIRYGGFLKRYKKTKVYVIIGFIFYFLAASLSFIGTAFSKLVTKNFYTIAGEKLYSLSLKLADSDLVAIWESWQAANPNFPIGFFLMDSLIEENLEIIGASAFLAATVSFLIYHQKKNKLKKSREK